MEEGTINPINEPLTLVLCRDRQAFEQHGDIASVQLVMRSAAKNRGFAYVHFRDPKDAAALLAASPDVFILGKKVDLR